MCTEYTTNLTTPIVIHLTSNEDFSSPTLEIIFYQDTPNASKNLIDWTLVTLTLIQT